MRACRLSIAEAHPSQVVKAVLDPPSQCAALLLADSSCLLLSSLFDHPPPFLIPPSCTDVCFLRLRRGRLPADSLLFSSSSSASSSSAETSSFSLSEALNKPIGPRSKPVTVDQSKIGGCSTIGISRHGSGDDSLFFLAAMPGKGGSCTDLMAWSCKVPVFVSTPIRLGCGKPCDPPLQANLVPAPDSRVARLDVPHGVSVKIAASVNVLVVYSPSVGKVWIMSAKLSGALGTKSDCSTGDRIPLSAESAEKAHESAETAVSEGPSKINPVSNNPNCVRADRKEKSTDTRGCLLLIKCAVVDCNGPVFALHLSLQHLLLGQLGGLRVWSLRPLIKGMKSQKLKGPKADLTDARKGSLFHRGRVARERIEGCDCGVAENRISDSFRGPTAIESSAAWVGAPCWKDRRAKSASLILAEPRNGFYETDEFLNSTGSSKSGITRAYPDGCIDQAAGSAAFIKQREETDSSGKSLQGYSEDTYFESNGWKSKQEARITQMGNGTSDLQHAVFSASRVADQESTPEELTIPQGRNGTLSCGTCDLEDWNSQHILSQSSMFSSSSGSSHFYVSYSCSASAPSPNVFCDASGAYPASCSNLPSTSSSAAGATINASLLSSMETSWGLHTTSCVKGAQEGDFLSFQGGKTQDNASQLPTRLAMLKQAVSIHGLSAGEFVILNSHGELHLLTLQHSIPEENSREQRGFRVSGNASLQPLICSMRIKLLVVLPVSLQSAAPIAYPASRILWISDGGHTIHIVTLPAREVSEEGMRTSLAEPSHLNVIQTIFTTERISFLYALSVSTVMVFTEGSILAYSMIGT